MNNTSILQIPFEFKNDELISLIDSLVPDTILERDNDLPVSIKILKGTISDISLEGKNIDIRLSVKVFLDKKVGSYSIASGEGELDLRLYSEIDIDENWNLKTKTSLSNYDWVVKPKIKLLGFDLSAPEIVEKYIDYKESDWMNQIDSTIAKSNILLKPIEKLIEFLSTPLIIDSAETIGLKIVPNSISLSPFQSGDNMIKSQITLSFTNELIPLKRYDFSDSIPIPQFKWNYIDNFDQKAVITLTMDQNQTQTLVDDFLTYQDSSTKSFDIRGNEIQVEDINIIFSKDIITSIVDFSGGKTGSITIKTRPLWNKKQKRLLLLNRSADIKLNNYGTQIFINLFRKKIQKKIMDELEETLNKKIKGAFDEANSLFEHAKFKNSIKIVNYNMPTQLEDDFLMIDISFNISGKITWNGINVFIENCYLDE